MFQVIKEIKAVFSKELIHIFNDSAVLRMAVILPLFQLIIFGFAINTDIDNIKTHILDYDRSSSSRELVQKLENSHYFQINKYVYSKQELINNIRAGDAQVGLVIPPDYNIKLKSQQPLQIQALIDGTESTLSSQAQSSLLQITNNISLENINSPETSTGIEVRSRLLFNPDQETSFFILPGFLGIIVFLLVSMLSSASLVREKAQGTFDQIKISPINLNAFMLGKITPYLLIGMVVFNICLFFMYNIFSIQVQGNILLLELAVFVYIFSALGLSIFVSSLATTETQATQFLFMMIMPFILLSGYIFPFDSMPVFFKGLGFMLPATYFIMISRGIILKGTLFMDILPLLSILVLFGLGLFCLGVYSFQSRMND